jgi:hypothetical protein
MPLRTRLAVAWLLATLLLGIGCVFLSTWAPPEDPHLTVCFFRLATHTPCPGCGLTRSVAHLLKGDVRSSVAEHPLGPVLAIEIAVAWVAGGFWVFNRVRLCSLRLLEAGLTGNAILLIGAWVVRLLVGDPRV